MCLPRWEITVAEKEVRSVGLIMAHDCYELRICLAGSEARVA
jgi:hypothetical protein